MPPLCKFRSISWYPIAILPEFSNSSFAFFSYNRKSIRGKKKKEHNSTTAFQMWWEMCNGDVKNSPWGKAVPIWEFSSLSISDHAHQVSFWILYCKSFPVIYWLSVLMNSFLEWVFLSPHNSITYLIRRLNWKQQNFWIH